MGPLHFALLASSPTGSCAPGSRPRRSDCRPSGTRRERSRHVAARHVACYPFARCPQGAWSETRAHAEGHVRRFEMKQDIHPDYVESTVTCSCGNTFKTHATRSELHIELCNQCHPFYTGQQKFVDTGGRVQRFSDKFGSAAQSVMEKEAAERDARQKAHEEAAMAAREARVAKESEKAERSSKHEVAEAAEAAQATEEPVTDEAPMRGFRRACRSGRGARGRGRGERFGRAGRRRGACRGARCRRARRRGACLRGARGVVIPRTRSLNER